MNVKTAVKPHGSAVGPNPGSGFDTGTPIVGVADQQPGAGIGGAGLGQSVGTVVAGGGTGAAGPVVVTVAPADDAALADLGGAGNENVTREDMATPFLLLLQGLSPEVDTASPKYLPGALSGMFCNTLTHQLYDGKQGLEIIDCYFEPLLTRWVPRNKGGGFKGVVTPDHQLYKTSKPSPDNELLRLCDDGTEIVNINQHYLLVRPYVQPTPGVGQLDLPWSPCVLGLTSTQIKKSRALNAELNLMRVTVAGQQRPIPRFATVFRLTAQAEKNAKGSYWGVRFDNLRRVNTVELALGRLLYEALAKGIGRAAPSEATHGAPVEGNDTPADQRRHTDEEIPY